MLKRTSTNLEINFLFILLQTAARSQQSSLVREKKSQHKSSSNPSQCMPNGDKVYCSNSGCIGVAQCGIVVEAFTSLTDIGCLLTENIFLKQTLYFFIQSPPPIPQ